MEKGSNYKKFIVIWFGQMIASIGSGLTSFGLNIYVFQQTRSASACSVVVLCAFLPMVLLTPFAGILADRFNKWKLMLMGDSFSAISLIAMLLFIKLGNTSIIMICICVFISSIFSSLMDPAYKSIVTDLLAPEQFSKASGLIQLASSAKYLISPLIAGILIKASGIETILIIDILTFVLTLASIIYASNSIVSIKKEQSKDSSYIQDLMEGWNSLVGNKGLMSLILLTTMVTFYVGFIEILLTPMLLGVTDESTLGAITSFGSIGMLATSIIIGFRGIKKNYISTLSSAFTVMGIVIFIVGSVINVYVIGIAAFIFFAMLPFANTSIDVLIRSSLERKTEGRVWGLISLISQLGYLVAYSISGILADHVFNPLLDENGALASSIGRLIGVGEGRGIGLMIIICGVSMLVTSYIIYINRNIKVLENNYLAQKKYTDGAKRL